MFANVFVERRVQAHARTQYILNKIHDARIHSIDAIGDWFGNVHKPYLHKRDKLNLFIGKKDGALIKPAPPAYGEGHGAHYYFVHQYNCLYECQYCYLQGYFSSPDIVFFVNHEEICDAIRQLCVGEHAQSSQVWFHGGEFSDCLALTGLTGEWPTYFDTIRQLPNAYLELRTKSVNIRPLLALAPCPRIVTTFSLSSAEQAARYDRGAPPVAARIKAAGRLAQAGHPIGIHLDPIIAATNFEEAYGSMLQLLTSVVAPSHIAYVSLGVVRFTADVLHALRRHYPDSPLTYQEFDSSCDGKIRYPRPMRRHILRTVERLCVAAGIDPDRIYWCMEEEEKVGAPQPMCGVKPASKGEALPTASTHS